MRHYLVLVCISRVRYFLKSRWAAAIYITTIIATFIVGHKIQDTCLQRPWTVEVFRIVLAFSSQLSCFLSSTILVLRVYHQKNIYLVFQIDRLKISFENELTGMRRLKPRCTNLCIFLSELNTIKVNCRLCNELLFYILLYANT